MTIVSGYQAEQIAEAVNSAPLPVDLVENRLFDGTNNMFSLALGLPCTGESLIFGNADVVYDESLFMAFVKTAPLDSIPVHVRAYLDESMKVEVAHDQRIVRIAKDVTKERALGISLDMYKLSQITVTKLREIILTQYLARGRLHEWAEVALNDVLSVARFTPWDIQGRPWIEVDTPEDLEEARRLVATREGVSEGTIPVQQRDAGLK